MKRSFRSHVSRSIAPMMFMTGFIIVCYKKHYVYYILMFYVIGFNMFFCIYNVMAVENKTSINLTKNMGQDFLSQIKLNQRILQIKIIPWFDRLLCSYEYVKQGEDGSVLRQTVTSYPDVNFLLQIHFGLDHSKYNTTTWVGTITRIVFCINVLSHYY